MAAGVAVLAAARRGARCRPEAAASALDTIKGGREEGVDKGCVLGPGGVGRLTSRTVKMGCVYVVGAAGRVYTYGGTGAGGCVVRAAVGRISFSEAELRANVQALLDAIIHKAASGLAGTKVSAQVVAGYMRDMTTEQADGQTVQQRSVAAMKRALSIVQQVHLSSTQGPGIRLRLDDVL